MAIHPDEALLAELRERQARRIAVVHNVHVIARQPTSDGYATPA